MCFSLDVTVTYLLLFPTLRIVEEWTSKYRAEELYMMMRQIDELTECLSSAMDNFPISCSSLEGMQLSSLRRWLEYSTGELCLDWSHFCTQTSLQHRILIGIPDHPQFLLTFQELPNHLFFKIQDVTPCPLLSIDLVASKMEQWLIQNFQLL